MERKRVVKRKCLGCGKEIDFNNNKFRPFCSHRCKMADLSSWLKGEYRISSSLFHMESDMESEDQVRQ